MELNIFFSAAGKHSPKGERRPFSEEANANSDVNSLLTPGAIDAYR